VRRALERHADRETRHIELSVNDGVLHVSGVVETPQERTVVLGALRGRRGVRELVDRLTVQPS
jgi:osmotically-inducible protein OsmY